MGINLINAPGAGGKMTIPPRVSGTMIIAGQKPYGNTPSLAVQFDCLAKYYSLGGPNREYLLILPTVVKNLPDTGIRALLMDPHGHSQPIPGLNRVIGESADGRMAVNTRRGKVMSIPNIAALSDIIPNIEDGTLKHLLHRLFSRAYIESSLILEPLYFPRSVYSSDVDEANWADFMEIKTKFSISRNLT